MKFTNFAAAIATLATLFPFVSGQTVFINEIHYDNRGTDTGEFIEIAGPVDTNLNGWSLVLYNGASGTPGVVYDTVPLDGLSLDRNPVDGIGFLAIKFAVNGIQNGPADGIALIDNAMMVVEFLSYEGTVTATEGLANGETSVDIGVQEFGGSSGTMVGTSLQRTGTGSVGSDFTFASSQTETPGYENLGQIIAMPSEAPSASPSSTPSESLAPSMSPTMSMGGKKGGEGTGETGGKKGRLLSVLAENGPN